MKLGRGLPFARVALCAMAQSLIVANKGPEIVFVTDTGMKFYQSFLEPDQSKLPVQSVAVDVSMKPRSCKARSSVR